MKVKLWILIAFLSGITMLYSSSALGENIGGFDCEIAKGQESLVITPAARATIQKLVNQWKADPSLVLILKGYADGNEWLTHDDAMNPAIALGRCAVAFKLVQEMGATEFSRIQYFIEEYEEKGPEYRGFTILLETSPWTSVTEFASLNNCAHEIDQSLIDLTNQLGDLENKYNDLLSNPYLIQLGIGATSYKNFPVVPCIYGVLGKGRLFVELDIAHSIFSKDQIMLPPYSADTLMRAYAIFSRFASVRISYLIWQNFILHDINLSIKTGWHWCEWNTYSYSGYYKWYDGPEVGVGIQIPLNPTLHFSGNVYWSPDRETTYPDPQRSWRRNCFRVSLNFLKTL